MDFWHNLVLGFSVAATPFNLLLAFVGVFLGTIIGVLPGIGPMTGIALLLLSFFMTTAWRQTMALRQAGK